MGSKNKVRWSRISFSNTHTIDVLFNAIQRFCSPKQKSIFFDDGRRATSPVNVMVGGHSIALGPCSANKALEIRNKLRKKVETKSC